MSTLNQWKQRLRRLGYPEVPRAERRTPTRFAVRRGPGSTPRPIAIRNISSTGMYLITGERWPIGQLLPMTIGFEMASQEGIEAEFPIQALVVRYGEDGIGLSFVLPPGMNPGLWEVLIDKAANLTNELSIQFMFKMLRTVVFFCRICRTEAEQPIHLLGGELDEARTETALQIVITAEKILNTIPGGETLRAHPGHVAHLIQSGSWAIGKLTRDLWAGLLVTSCTPGGADESNSEFVDLLVNVTPTQALIFVTACNKALSGMMDTDDHPATQIFFTPEEMQGLTGKSDMTRVATDIAYLFHSGLLDRNFDFTSYIPTENFEITPSRLGLKFYRRCMGHLADARPVVGHVEGA